MLNVLQLVPVDFVEFDAHVGLISSVAVARRHFAQRRRLHGIGNHSHGEPQARGFFPVDSELVLRLRLAQTHVHVTNPRHVRNQRGYSLGHVPQAIQILAENLDFDRAQRLLPEELARHVDGLDLRPFDPRQPVAQILQQLVRSSLALLLRLQVQPDERLIWTLRVVATCHVQRVLFVHTHRGDERPHFRLAGCDLLGHLRDAIRLLQGRPHR